MAEPNAILKRATPGQFAGVEVACPRADCDWRDPFASAVVVNEYGVKDPIPDRCEIHGLPVRTEKIVTIIGGDSCLAADRCLPQADVR